MSKIGTIKLKGTSGKEYDFNIYPFGTDFKKFGAVYYVSKRVLNSDGSVKHTAIYIGITDDMSERFDNHHKKDCFKKHEANCISVHECSSKTTREEIEKDLVSKIKPPCNELLK